MKKTYLLASLAVLMAACSPQETTTEEVVDGLHGTLTVAAASDLKFALDELLESFGAKHENLDLKVTYGSSGNLRTQIEQGAPFELFLSADRKFPEMLVASGRGEEGSLFDYAVGRIVIWVRNESPLDPETSREQSLIDPRVRKIAIANPEHAPYGQAAVDALKTLGIYEKVEDRFVLGENIAQTAQFVESGAADIGVIALALAVAPTMAERGRYWEIPLAHFPRMIQGGVVVSHAKNPEAAHALRAAILSESGRELLRSYGFIMPDETDEAP